MKIYLIHPHQRPGITNLSTLPTIIAFNRVGHIFMYKHHIKRAGFYALPTFSTFFLINIINSALLVNSSFGTGFSAFSALVTNPGTESSWLRKFCFNPKRCLSRVYFVKMINCTYLQTESASGTGRFIHFYSHSFSSINSGKLVFC